jgi:heat shock protein HtpX
MARQHVIPHDHPNYPAIRRRMIITWIKTSLGYLTMLALIALALWAFGFNFHFTWGWGLISPVLTLVLPIVMWWYSAKIALWQTKSAPADPNNPDHARLLAIVDIAFKESDLKYKPPVYVSADPRPNAFATGPIHRKAVVAATEGLFKAGMTDLEIKEIFAHELAHVRNYDVAINSMLAVLSSVFSMIVNQIIQIVLGAIGLFKRLLGIKPQHRFLPTILSNIISYVIFWVVGQVTRIIQFFVVRSRESGADATAAYFTGNPCGLATALQKLVLYAEKNRPKTQREIAYYRAWRPLMIIDPLYDTVSADSSNSGDSSGGIFGTIKRWWKNLQLTHPPVPDRVRALERMNGGKCPVVPMEWQYIFLPLSIATARITEKARLHGCQKK